MPAADWSRFRTHVLELPVLGISLDLSGLRMPEGFAGTMEPRLREAYSAMAALEGGAIANPDEKRMVGHYWLRDPACAPDPAIRSAIESTVARIKTFATAVHRGEIRPEKAGRFENVAVVGIGG